MTTQDQLVILEALWPPLGGSDDAFSNIVIVSSKLGDNVPAFLAECDPEIRINLELQLTIAPKHGQDEIEKSTLPNVGEKGPVEPSGQQSGRPCDLDVSARF